MLIAFLKGVMRMVFGFGLIGMAYCMTVENPDTWMGIFTGFALIAGLYWGWYDNED
jgi:hypothetical protein